MLVVLTFLGRSFVAASLGLGIDESYTVATARAFVLSTYDHPPLAWWLAGAARWLFGTEAPLAVRLPFVALFALTTWLMFALTRLLFGSRAGWFAACTLNLAPVLAWTTGSFVLPDGPLIAALLGGAYCVARVTVSQPRASPLWWLAAGACGGLACLSKLHGIFLFAGTAVFLLTAPSQRRWLLSSWPWAGAGVAALLLLPVIAWNIQHDWVSFAFQGARARLSHFEPWAPLAVLAGQAVYFLPWLWVPLALSLLRGVWAGSRDEPAWLMICLAAGPILVFTLVAWSGNRVLYHWAAPGYLFGFVLLGRDLASTGAKLSPRVRNWLAATMASVVLLIVSAVGLTRLPWPPLSWLQAHSAPYPLVETVSWHDLRGELSRRGVLDRPNQFVAATRWHEAGRIDVALEGALPVRCLCLDARGYGVLYRNAASAGQDALIVGTMLLKSKVEKTYGACFDGIEELTPVTLREAGFPRLTLQLFLARRFKPQSGASACGNSARPRNAASLKQP